ncbi:hypothetical protein AB0H77_25580 [Streptomyces sp. NPDC050844]|uniref:hypothetical protein n=1 Tax=Streptomyces sp. NPDC050844 TaxID=3155790 RepID=UPI0033CE1B01
MQGESASNVQAGAGVGETAERDREMAEHLASQARAEELNLVGENRLLKGLVKPGLEAALQAEGETAALLGAVGEPRQIVGALVPISSRQTMWNQESVLLGDPPGSSQHQRTVIASYECRAD